MTNHELCSYGDREAALIDFLYGESDPGLRTAFEQHLAECPACRADALAFRTVRRALAGWAPPEPIRALDHAALGGPRLAAPPSELHDRSRRNGMPVWARVAAAVLCVGVGLGAANVRVTSSPTGLEVRTGWMTPPTPVTARTDEGDWRTEVADLRNALTTLQNTQAMLASRPQPVDAGEPVDEDELLRQVKALIARSERRQQSELALRIGDVVTDLQAQRRADLARIDRTIGVVQSNTGLEVLRQREMLNSLAVRVSSQRP
ncbi:MAG: anti-sigma factor [Vicinamibacterales bacterium]